MPSDWSSLRQVCWHSATGRLLLVWDAGEQRDADKGVESGGACVMTTTRSSGAERFLDHLVGEEGLNRWIRKAVRFWRFILVGLVVGLIWAPNQPLADPELLLWAGAYLSFVMVWEILRYFARSAYEHPIFRLVRIQVDLLAAAGLLYLAPTTAAGYLWFIFVMPIVATLAYFRRFHPPGLCMPKPVLQFSLSHLPRAKVQTLSRSLWYYRWLS